MRTELEAWSYWMRRFAESHPEAQRDGWNFATFMVGVVEGMLEEITKAAEK